MTESAVKSKRYTPAEYYALERDAVYRSEYFNGEIFAMAGGTAVHSQITANVTGSLWSRLRGQPCRAYESNLRLSVVATGLRTYPDASVYCDPLQFDPADPGRTTALNPTAVFEVWSPSTEGYDRGIKAEHFRRIKSLRAYVIVSQDRAHVELHERGPDGRWTIQDFDGLESAAHIEAIDVELPLSEIYDRVEFPEVAPSTIAPVDERERADVVPPLPARRPGT